MHTYSLLPRLLPALLAGAILLVWASSPARATREREQDYDFLHTIDLQLGGEDNQMAFFPGEIVLDKGESYRLVMTNRGPVVHEFASPTFKDHIETDKVEVFDAQGNEVAYVVGSVREIELQPGARVVWSFTAVKAAEQIDMLCELPGHLEAGMRGVIRIRE